MEKNNKKVNALIKKKNLIQLLNLVGINRITPKSLDFLESKFKKDILGFCTSLKQELEISGKKTLEVENIKHLINSQELKGDFDY